MEELRRQIVAGEPIWTKMDQIEGSEDSTPKEGKFFRVLAVAQRIGEIYYRFSLDDSDMDHLIESMRLECEQYQKEG